MDSREQPQPQPQQQQQQQQLPTMMLGPTSYPSMMSPATARLPFSANNHAPPPPEPFNGVYNNNNTNDSTCEALKPCGLGSEKKKRGRPRKYSSDGNIALGLAPTNASSSSAEPSKKHRGRPPGSSKKQMDALGIGGVGFTPHVILADAGEDIAAKLVAFFQQGPRTVCILSATGAVCNVTIRKKPESGEPGVTAALEGPLEILSLSATLQLSENNGGHSRISGLTVSLASPDGHVFGGELIGPLTAATPLQVIVGSFIADGKKSSSSNLKSGPSSLQQSQLLNFGAPGTPTSPTSHGHSTESSEDNENGHFSKGLGPGPGGAGLYNNASQSMHNMSMYHHQLWAGQTHQ